ncbi:MAG: hypothetical protein GY799_19855 [Desulfobulbaceae bacterium]|nr:hypothetical protein [Desulfobulbaceae bacterium]
MKKRYFRHIGIIITGLLLHSSISIADDCKIPSGNAWTNELGSEMTVNIDTSGAITGTYSSAVGCGAGKPRPMAGFCNGYAVTFSVSWQECGATTAWNGTYGDGTITTLWQFVSAKKPSWDSIMAGSNTFKQK